MELNHQNQPDLDKYIKARIKATEFVAEHPVDLRQRYSFGVEGCQRKLDAIRDLRNSFPNLLLRDAKEIIENYFGPDGMRLPPVNEGKAETITFIKDRVLIENFLLRMHDHMTNMELSAFNRMFSQVS